MLSITIVILFLMVMIVFPSFLSFISIDGKLFNIQLAQNTSAVTHDLHFFIDGCAGLFSDNRTLPFVYDNI